MSAPPPTRRGFLQVALLGGGALALGITLPGCHPYDTKTAEKADKTGLFSPNAWLTIHPDDRIVYVLDRVEMGQGTMTSQTMLLAEELDVDPRKIHIELAPAHPAYDNPDPQIGFQITGGSTSTKASWEVLRKAGAAAREMLRAGAAATWGVPVAECTAADGAIVHAPSGKRGTYGQFTRAAAHQPIPSPALKPPSSFKWIGKSLERFDGRMKVDGTAIYGIDVRVPGMLRAVVVRCPVFGGKLRDFDAVRAKAVPGVIDVFDIPSGVAVVAKNTWTAKKAAQLVTVNWDEGPRASLSTASLRAAYAELARHEAKVVRDDGSFATAEKSGRVLEATYEVPYLAHATMEPMNATAHVTDDSCELWLATQSPAIAFETARSVLGYAPEKIRVHQTLLGGGFGRRLGQDFGAEAIHISRRIKRPVMVIWSREDDMQHDYYRPATFNVLKGTVDGLGRISGWFHRIVAQSIIAQAIDAWAPAIAGVMPQAFKPFMARTASHLYKSELVADETASEGAGDFAYAIPNLRVEYAEVEPGIPVGFWRSVGHSENAFIAESFVDELAHAAKRDPLDVRRELLRASPRHLGVLELAAKKASYGTPSRPGVFRGIAVCKSFNSWCAQVAEVEVVGKTIKVRRVVAAIDCGIVVNPDLVRAQVESAIVFGLSAALKQAITLKNGRVEQTNFNDYQLLRMFESPEIEVHIVPSKEAPTGVGEPGLPPVAPAVANAVFLATGQRLRVLPLALARMTMTMRARTRWSLLLAVAVATTIATVRPLVAESQPAPASDGVAHFLAVARVLQSPRCMNCHPVGDAPLQTDQSLPHAMNVSRKSNDAGLACTACHRGTNNPFPHGPPGVPNWRLPPAATPMVFEKRTPAELCAQIKNPQKNGGKSLDALADHLAHDPLVLWGWAPGPGRSVPPISHDELAAHAKAWVAAGAPCPP